MSETEKTLMILESAGSDLYRLLLRLTLNNDIAEDLMQELFLKLNLSKGFAKAEKPKAYAMRVAMNLAFDFRKKRKKSDFLSLAKFEIEPTQNTPSPINKLIHDEEIGQILEATGTLTKSYREAFVMQFIQNDSYDVIGEQMGKTPHQVRALCHKALTKLRKHLS